ncbi:HNH endonuclease [Ferruginibacter sp.]
MCKAYQQPAQIPLQPKPGIMFVTTFCNRMLLICSRFVALLRYQQRLGYQQERKISNMVETVLLLIISLGVWAFSRLKFEIKREHRRNYYRDEYLKSDAWKRKRYVVLKRDNWRCVNCGAPATQVHHKKYLRKNIGKEPIEWLVSVCKKCHDSLHQ